MRYSSSQDRIGRRETVVRKALLSCGAAYGFAYVLSNDVLAVMLYGGYSRMDQAVSELSATAAPSQTFLRAMLPVFTALMVAFGIGVWLSAAGLRRVKVLGALLVGFGLTGVMWLPFPMSSRSEMVSGTTPANDVGHLVLSGVTVVLIVTAVGVGASVRGGWFRVYSLITILVVLGAGAATGSLSAGIPEGEPTPWLGLYERTSIGAWLLWLAVLAVLLMERPVDRDLSVFACERAEAATPRELPSPPVRVAG